MPATIVKRFGKTIDQQEAAMGKAHESAKEARKQPVHTMKEKRSAKRSDKTVPHSPPYMGHHYQQEAKIS